MEEIILVGLLTLEQKNLIEGQQYTQDSFFNPIQDNLNRWIISLEEMNGKVTNPEFFWVRDLPLIEYVPKPIPQIN